MSTLQTVVVVILRGGGGGQEVYSYITLKGGFSGSRNGVGDNDDGVS